MGTCDNFKFTLHFYFQEWSNVILSDLDTAIWVTKNSIEPIVISGTKYTNNSVVLSNATYEKLPIPKYLYISLFYEEYKLF